jgi:hypothetical protein
MRSRVCRRVSPLLTSPLSIHTASRLRLHQPFHRLQTLSMNHSARSGGQQHASMALASRQQLTQLLTDAHCHPQLDPANMQAVLQLQSSKVAAMCVSYDVDWELMLQLHHMAGRLQLGCVKWQQCSRCTCCSDSAAAGTNATQHGRVERCVFK